MSTQSLTRTNELLFVAQCFAGGDIMLTDEGHDVAYHILRDIAGPAGRDQRARGSGREETMEEERKDVLEEIHAEATDVIGGLVLAETWLTEGWDGTLEKTTHVMPGLADAVAAARGCGGWDVLVQPKSTAKVSPSLTHP